MKCLMIRDMPASRRAAKQYPTGIVSRGTVIDHPDAHVLVRMGVAVAADEECQAATRMTPADTDRAAAAYEKVEKGIHPEDYAAFDGGLMIGYHPDGSWIPGPNYVEPDEDDDDEE